VIIGERMCVRAQANVLAVVLGVSLIIILLFSASYMLSSISVRTAKTLELLNEQARADSLGTRIKNART